MRPQSVCLLLFSILTSVGFAQTKKADQVGYIYCPSDKPERSVPVFLGPCMNHRVGNFDCGHKIGVVAHSGAAVKVITSAGSTVFVSSDVVSQKVDELIPVDVEVEPAPECNVKVAEPDPTKNRGPRGVFTPDPHFPRHRNRSTGSVLLGLTVGTDGRPHDIKVEGSLGKDYDEAAIDAVRQWRFEPALRDGQPAAVHVDVTLDFRHYTY
jgi:TonB family protein